MKMMEYVIPFDCDEIIVSRASLPFMHMSMWFLVSIPKMAIIYIIAERQNSSSSTSMILLVFQAKALLYYNSYILRSSNGPLSGTRRASLKLPLSIFCIYWISVLNNLALSIYSLYWAISLSSIDSISKVKKNVDPFLYCVIKSIDPLNF